MSAPGPPYRIATSVVSGKSRKKPGKRQAGGARRETRERQQVDRPEEAEAVEAGVQALPLESQQEGEEYLPMMSGHVRGERQKRQRKRERERER